MQELLLFASVPAQHHEQLIKVLAGICAVQPIEHIEQHMVCKPNRNPAQQHVAHIGAAQAVPKTTQKEAQRDVYFVQLVRSAERPSSKTIIASNDNDEKMNIDSLSKPQSTWSLQFRDVPEVVRQRPVTSRMIFDMPILAGDPLNFIKSLDYSPTSSYYTSGQRFRHHNISILINRVHILEDMAIGQEQIESILEAVELSHHPLLDKSGTFTLQAAILIDDGANVELVHRGMTELLNFQAMMKGVIDLVVGDRLAMDTRLR